eukprot:TRINITY_DN13322_c0_g1_i1.p1 TRINITY_DN13322_c0_g1~~TRINITY_DN13322_c0_g1_i1.p1  ORF type:complete len:579 (+),score=155.06 TRINITY_DN13322_c0_g1_i1:141-1877(+)
MPCHRPTCHEIRKAPTAKTILYCAICILFGVLISALGPSLPAFAAMMHTTPEKLNFVFYFRGGGRLVSAFVSGFLFDRFPGHPIVALSVACVSITGFVLPFAATVSEWFWGALFAFVGVGSSLFDVGVNTLIPWLYGDKLRPYMQLVNFTWGIGSVLAPLIVQASLSSTGSANSAYWLSSLFGIPLIVMSLFLLSPKRPQEAYQTFEEDEDAHGAFADEDDDNAASVPKDQYFDATAAPVVRDNSRKSSIAIAIAVEGPIAGTAVTAPDSAQPSARISRLDDRKVDSTRSSRHISMERTLMPDGTDIPRMLSVSFSGDMAVEVIAAQVRDEVRASSMSSAAPRVTKPRISRRMVLLISLVIFIYYGYIATFGSWLASYAISLGFSQEMANYLNSVLWGTLTATRLFAVPLSQRVTPTQQLLFNMIGVIVLSILFLFSAMSHIVVWVVTALIGIFLATIFAASVSLPSALGRSITAKDTMWYVIGVAVSELTIPGVLGVMFDRLGYGVLPWSLLIMSILQLVVFVVLWFLEIRGVQVGEVIAADVEKGIAQQALTEMKEVVAQFNKDELATKSGTVPVE